MFGILGPQGAHQKTPLGPQVVEGKVSSTRPKHTHAQSGKGLVRYGLLWFKYFLPFRLENTWPILGETWRRVSTRWEGPTTYILGEHVCIDTPAINTIIHSALPNDAKMASMCVLCRWRPLAPPFIRQLNGNLAVINVKAHTNGGGKQLDWHSTNLFHLGHLPISLIVLHSDPQHRASDW